jgi:prepilin-type N-terminal cleavage/methylation domain-containing protein
MSSAHPHGFTLVELIAVIVVLAVLAGVAIPRMVNLGARARATAIAAHLARVNQAMLAYERDRSPNGNITIDPTNYIGSGLDVYLMTSPFVSSSFMTGGNVFRQDTWGRTQIWLPQITEPECLLIDQAAQDDGTSTTGSLVWSHAAGYTWVSRIWVK